MSTLKRKLRRYRQGGFAALPRKRRKDRGALRAAPAEVVQTAIAAKREQPKRSAQTLNLILGQRHGKTVARSTLYRHLKAAGATRLKLGILQEPVRKRWTCAHTHDLWVGDFADGPCVLLQGLSVRTYLSAFIDAHSRYVVAARYYLRESLDVLCDTLVRALAIHGVPLALYLDNAKVYHAHSLRVLCCRLHIQLLHRPPGDPAPGGLIERFIPRLLNNLATLCLIQGAAKKQKLINVPLVDEAPSNCACCEGIAMTFITKPYLRRLRNDIDVRVLIADVLQLEHRSSNGRFRFLCPLCQEFNTAVNPATNLGRCFRCLKNFNPIDLVIVVKHFDFLQAVDFLDPLLPEEPESEKCPRSALFADSPELP